MNWTKIRNEYINGHISYRKLAEKHDISWQTLRDRATKEKWFDARKAQREKIQAKTEQKTAEKISEQQSDLAANINKAAVELLEKLNIAIQQTDLYIERTKTKLPKKVRDKQTGETFTVWQEEETVRVAQKEVINVGSVAQLTGALKTLQLIQMAMQEGKPVESPQINITVTAATPADVEEEEEE